MDLYPGRTQREEEGRAVFLCLHLEELGPLPLSCTLVSNFLDLPVQTLQLFDADLHGALYSHLPGFRPSTDIRSSHSWVHRQIHVGFFHQICQGHCSSSASDPISHFINSLVELYIYFTLILLLCRPQTNTDYENEYTQTCVFIPLWKTHATIIQGILCSKVAVCVRDHHTIASEPEKAQGQVPEASAQTPSLYNLACWVFQLKDTLLMYIVESQTLNPYPTSLSKASATDIFPEDITASCV